MVFFKLDFFTITDFGDDGSAADGRVKSAVFFPGLFGFFCFHLGSFLVFFFQLEFFTITGFGDDGSGADGRVKFAVFFFGGEDRGSDFRG